jgi:hypothetical protein
MPTMSKDRPHVSTIGVFNVMLLFLNYMGHIFRLTGYSVDMLSYNHDEETLCPTFPVVSSPALCFVVYYWSYQWG